MRIRKWLGSPCDYTSAYFGCLPATRCTKGNLRRWRGRAGKSIVETDSNKHPRGTPNGNTRARSECNLVKKKKSILMNRPRKLNWNEVYLWLGFGRHNQGRKIETFWKHLGGKKKRMPYSFDFAHDVSFSGSCGCVLQHSWSNLETVSQYLSAD